jgi:predicted porin
MRRIVVSLLMLLIPILCRAENGIYVTADTGIVSQIGMPGKNATGATHIESNWLPPALRFGLGYNHDFNLRYGIALETGIGWYARTIYYYSNNTTTHVRAETSEYLIAGTYHFNNKHDLYLKLGGIRLTPVVAGTNAPHQETKIAFESALGTTYYFNRNYAITLTYVYVPSRNPNTIDDFKIKTQGLSEFLLGIKYIFAV